MIIDGGERTLHAALVGREILTFHLDKDANGGNGAIVFTMAEDYQIVLEDRGQSCCETRYLTTDDDLAYFNGARFVGIGTTDYRETHDSDRWEDHEQEFVIVVTSKGVFTICAHNRHNGYYRGINLRFRQVGCNGWK